MKELFIKYFRDASSYQSIDPTCFNLTEYTETWLINHKEQLRIGVVSQQRELLLQGYKDGFQAAVDCLVGASEAIKNRTLQ